MTQAGVAGAVIVIEGIFNRETRDALSIGEKSYLNSTFQYTGGGLVLTALAARSLFKSGVAFRIMAANPCSYNLISTSDLNANKYLRGRTWGQPCRQYRVHDGCLLYTARKDSAKASILASKSLFSLGNSCLNAVSHTVR